MNQSKPNNKSYSSDETQRQFRIDKLNRIKDLGVNPFAVDSKRDFNLTFVDFWFDYVVKHDFPTRIDEMQARLHPDLEYHSDIVLANVIIDQALHGYALEEYEEYTREWIESQENNQELIENFENYLEIRKQIISEIKEFLESKTNVNEYQIADYIEAYFQDADFAGDHKPSLVKNQTVTLAGRIKTKRGSGKIAFAVVEDESLVGGFQFVFKQDLVQENEGELNFKNFVKLVDEGDYIQATGKLELSQSGQPSLFVDSYKILTKSIRPLPDKLEYNNLEQRYLDRTADFKLNTLDENGLSTRDIVRIKSKYWQIWREEMEIEGFLPVEIPVLEQIPGGAEAKPFVTYYNELDQDMYLRISLELPLKKLIAGGFESVYEIGRIFRNEGSSPQHLQEYTQIEWYKSYTDYIWAAKFVKRVYQRIVMEILGDTKQIDYNGNEINWGDWCTPELAAEKGWEMIGGWPMIPYFDAMRYFSNGEIDTENKTAEELVELGKKHDIDDLSVELGIGTLLDKLWKKVRVNTRDPFFLCLPPVELEPLAKRDPKNPNLTQRWQIVAGGAELGKAFSELNDPIDQFGRFQEQQKARDAGNDEAQFMDEGYVKAMEYGMPPMSGFGTSERFVSFLLGKHIRECVTFPHIKSNENQAAKTKETNVAHCVVLKNDDIELWEQINASSHLSASFAAREGRKLFYTDSCKSSDGTEILMNIQDAIVIKQADSSNELLELKKLAESNNLTISVFTKAMIKTSDDSKIVESYSKKPIEDIEFRGILVYGKINTVRKITENFQLWSGDNISKKETKEKEINNFVVGETRLLALEDNTYLFKCDAKILEIGESEVGKYIVLDNTVFYPQGGGQPSDIGSIKNSSGVFNVTKCQKIDDKIYHFGNFENGEMSKGDVVQVEIEKESRKLNARIHTAGHMIDEAVKNLGWDIKPEKGYHFVQGPYVQYFGELENPAELIEELNAEINRLVNTDKQVSYRIFETTQEPNRQMIVEGYDSCACAGTHVKNLLEIGKVNIRKIKSKKGQVKISYEVV